MTQAIELDPNNANHHAQLAQILREMGEPNKALIAAMGAVAAAPDQPHYHYWIGDLLMSLGRYSEALESFQAAIELSPGDDHLFLRTAVAFWADGKKKQAIKAIRLASDLEPSKNLYHGLLAVFLRLDNQMTEAEQEDPRAGLMDRFDVESLQRILKELGILPD
jgi:tetratricopeptide (TPR) repeat protein